MYTPWHSKHGTWISYGHVNVDFMGQPIWVGQILLIWSLLFEAMSENMDWNVSILYKHIIFALVCEKNVSKQLLWYFLNDYITISVSMYGQNGTHVGYISGPIISKYMCSKLNWNYKTLGSAYKEENFKLYVYRRYVLCINVIFHNINMPYLCMLILCAKKSLLHVVFDSIQFCVTFIMNTREVNCFIFCILVKRC